MSTHQPAVALTDIKPPRMSRFPAWVKSIPFFLMHLACLLVFLPQVEATALALTLCFGFYLLQML